MNTSSITLSLGVVLLVICLGDGLSIGSSMSQRQKRGFRGDAATRVAHGFGKRDYQNPTSQRFSHLSLGALEKSPSTLDGFNDGLIMTVDELAQLMSLHSNLAKAVLKKFVDIDGDDFISTEELFRPVINK
uniref:EF-hand domain-containing protein n=1 Tax=Arion vulgaris TaxID=1028688 RepID=A0A0B6ZHR1_9EUPU